MAITKKIVPVNPMVAGIKLPISIAGVCGASIPDSTEIVLNIQRIGCEDTCNTGCGTGTGVTYDKFELKDGVAQFRFDEMLWSLPKGRYSAKVEYGCHTCGEFDINLHPKCGIGDISSFGYSGDCAPDITLAENCDMACGSCKQSPCGCCSGCGCFPCAEPTGCGASGACEPVIQSRNYIEVDLTGAKPEVKTVFTSNCKEVVAGEGWKASFTNCCDADCYDDCGCTECGGCSRRPPKSCGKHYPR